MNDENNQTGAVEHRTHGAQPTSESGDDDTITSNTSGSAGTGNGAFGVELEELTKLQMDLVQAQTRIEELTDTSKRALADLTNYRRMVEQERIQYVAFANSSFIREILPIADNFARAFTHVPSEILETEWYKGVVQIEQQLIGFLKRQGVEEIPSSIGQPMDANLHEPLLTGPGEKDTVIEELEKGYTLGGQVLRPTKVKVGNGE